MRITDETPHGEVVAWLRAELMTHREGATCPTCTRRTRIYQRKLNSGMARALIRMYRHSPTEFMYKPDVLEGILKKVRDETQLHWWGLIEEATEVTRDDGGKAGWWRVTDRGRAFIEDGLLVPKFVRTYADRFQSFEGEKISIVDALGSKFNLRELLHGEDPA